MNIIRYHILLISYYNKYVSISLSDISILIYISLFREKNVEYRAIINKFFSFLKIYLYISIYFYCMFFLVNSINNNVIRE